MDRKDFKRIMEVTIIRKFNMVCEYGELCMLRQILRTHMEQMPHDNFDDEESFNAVKAFINEIDKVLDRIK